MQEQAAKLAQAVGVFRIDGGQAQAAAPQRVMVAPQRVPRTAPGVVPARTAAQPAASRNKAPVPSGEWEEF